jgi:nitrite reductase (NADH) small subunit
MADWIRVCALADIPRQGARVVSRAGSPAIALFRTADDRVFALVDRCPHKGGPLSQGIVHGHRVACPLHNWSIELATGEAVAPDAGCTNALRVELRGAGVYLQRDDVAPSAAAACAQA